MSDVTVHGPSVCLSICMSSVTLMHPAKAVEQNQMPFGRNIEIGDLGADTVADFDPSQNLHCKFVAKPLQIVEWLL